MRHYLNLVENKQYPDMGYWEISGPLGEPLSVVRHTVTDIEMGDGDYGYKGVIQRKKPVQTFVSPLRAVEEPRVTFERNIVQCAVWFIGNPDERLQGAKEAVKTFLADLQTKIAATRLPV